MFKKALSGIFAAAAATGVFSAIAPANAAPASATTSVKATVGIQQAQIDAKEAQKKSEEAKKKAQSAENALNKAQEEAVKVAKDAPLEAENAIKKAREDGASAIQKANDEGASAIQRTKEEGAIAVQRVRNEGDRAIQRVRDNAERAIRNARPTQIASVTEAWNRNIATAQNTATQNVTNAQNRIQDNIRRIEAEIQTKIQAAENTVRTKVEAAQNTSQAKIAAAENKVQQASSTFSKANTEAASAADLFNSSDKIAQSAWGNWTKTHTVQDKSTDKSGFQSIINEFQQFVQKERLELKDVGAKKLDPAKLFLQHDHNVRVWFINEGAGYRNQLAYEATKKTEYDKGMIFSDVSCTFGCELGNGSSGVLDIGDYVDLGRVNGGARLNFLLKGNGANDANGHIYGADARLNPDKFEHMVAYEYKGYLLMGIEDLWMGGDKDYNDTVFVVDFGKGNLKTTEVPEPSAAIALLGVTGAGMMVRRRRKNKFQA
jgi:hypothetical protein